MTATTLATSRASESKAASAYERMRARAPRESAPSARVRTRKVGFNLGGFGLTFTQKDLELEKGKAKQTPDLASMDPETVDATREYKQYQARQSRRVDLIPDPSPQNRKRTTSAYAQQVRRFREESVPRSILLSVV